jgi:hypothetical protein
MSASKLLPKQLYGIRLSRKAKDTEVDDVRAAFTHKTKTTMDAHVKSINKYSYTDEKVELLKGTITWEIIDTQQGELERP